MAAPWALYKGDYARAAYTALSGAAGDFTRSVHLRPGGPVSFPFDTVRHPTRAGAFAGSSVVIADARSDVLVIETEYTGTATGSDVTLAVQDELADLYDILNPYDGEWWLRLDRNDAGAVALSHERLVRIATLPEWQVKNGDPKLVFSKVYTLEIGLAVLYSYWVKATRESQAFAGVGTSYTSTSNLSNTGQTDDVGIRAVITAKTGAPTKLYINNTTTGRELIVSAPSGFAANDVIDFFCDDPRSWSFTTTNAAHFGDSAADADCRLARGTNNVKLKVDSGTADVTLYWRRERFTP